MPFELNRLFTRSKRTSESIPATAGGCSAATFSSWKKVRFRPMPAVRIRMAEIANAGVRRNPDGARALADQRHVAEGAAGGIARLGGRCAVGGALFRFQLEMRADLAGEILVPVHRSASLCPAVIRASASAP